MMRRISREDAVLLIIDVQSKLFPLIDDFQDVERNIIRLIEGTHVLGVPAVVTEQYPQGIGHTIESIQAALAATHGGEAIQKMTFSSCGSDPFLERIEQTGRNDIIVCGIEAHVCVHQTVIDLLDLDYRVWIVEDAVSSRTARNRDIALRRMANEGGFLTSTEMILFELTETCGTDEFRAISKLVK